MRKFTTLFFLAFFGMVSCAKANTMKSQPLHLPSSSGGCLITPEIISDLHKGIPTPTISGKFHNSIAEVVAKVCEIMRQEFNINEVILSGGVWQNKLLLKKTLSMLERSEFLVYIHQQVPANDGGLALGQAAIAIWNYRQ